MESVDAELRARNVPIHARAFHGAIEVDLRLGLGMPLYPLPEAASLDDFSSAALAVHVRDWFKARYGDRLRIPLTPAWTAANLGGDAWKVRLPLLFGGALFYADADFQTPAVLSPQANRSGAPVVNVLTLVEGLTPEYARSIPEAHLVELMQHFVVALETVGLLRTTRDAPFVTEAMGDLEVSAISLVAQPPQYGPSRWASLQASEKLMKAYISLAGGTVQKTHRVHDLAKTAIQLGLELIGDNLLNEVQCDPGARYGEVPYGFLDAVVAHYSTYRICRTATYGILERLPAGGGPK